MFDYGRIRSPTAPTTFFSVSQRPLSTLTCWHSGFVVSCFVYLGFAIPVHGNGIDRIDPSNPTHMDAYHVQVDSDSPTVSFSQRRIDGRSTLDGRRHITLSLNGGTSASSSKLYGDSFLELNNDATTSSVLTLDYGRGEDLNRNFIWTHRPFNSLAIDVTEVSSGSNGVGLGSGRFTLTLRSGSVVGTSTNAIDFDHAGTYYFSFGDPSFVDLRFSDIDEVILTLTTTTPGSDFRIGSIYRTAAVPEPSSWALFGSAAVGLLGYGLRRRRLFQLGKGAGGKAKVTAPRPYSSPNVCL